MAIPTGKVVKMELGHGEALVDGLIERWRRLHRERGLRPFERDRSAHLNKAEQGGLVFHLRVRRFLKVDSPWLVRSFPSRPCWRRGLDCLSHDAGTEVPLDLYYASR